MKSVKINLLFVLLLSIVLAGCGNSGNAVESSESASPSAKASPTNGASEAPTDEPVTLKLWAYADDSNESQKEVIRKFEEANPNIKVEPEFLPYNGGPEKIQVAVAGNNAPDLLLDMNARLLTFASQGKIAALDDIITEEDKQDIEESIWSQSQLEGKTYLFPTAATNVGYMINRTLFKEAGVEHLLPKEPDKTWDYEHFRQALKAVTKDGVYGTAFYAGNEQADAFTFALLWGYGAKTFNDDFSKGELNSPEGVKALEYMISLMDEGVVAPGAATLDAGTVLEMFNQKKIAVTIGGVDNVEVVKQGLKEGSIKEPFDVDLVMVPGDQPKSISYVGGISAFDNGDEKRLAASKKFIQFWTSKESMVTLGEWVTSSRKSVAEEIYKDKPITLYATNVLSKYAGTYGGQVIGFPEIRAAFFPELQAAFTKSKTPQQALDDFTAKVNGIIEKHKK